MKHKLPLFLLLLLIDATSFAQDYYTIAGQVCDASNGDPMHFVSVSLAGSRIANVTNSEGVFTLKLPTDVKRDSSIFLSHLGYLEASFRISDFEGTSVDNPFKIALTPVSVKLDAAIVNANEAETLVRTAYSRVKDNYPQEAEAMTAFYRELIKKGNVKYISLSEAILDINKTAYHGFAADRVGIYKGRGTINYDSSDTLFVKCQGGVNALLDIDIVRNPFVGVYDSHMFDFYDFRMGESVVMDENVFYRVDFNQKPSVDEILFRGSIFIEAETLAIGRIEFEMNVEGRDDASSLFVVKKPTKMSIEVENASYVVNFKKNDGLWYYDYGHIAVNFIAKYKLSPFRQHYSVVSEMAVTDHRPGQFEISDDSRLRLRDMLSEKVTVFTDEMFWENYNVIEPDATIDAIVRRIVRQLRRRE